MAQVSNVQSRTLRVFGALPESVKTALSAQTGVVVLEKESHLGAGKVKSFVSADNISSVIELFGANNVQFRPHFYSLFVKFSTELSSGDVEKLNDTIYSIVPDSEISYSRVDSNGHTGKVVVDRFEDYNTLRAYSGEFTFYKFNRTKAQTRGPPPSSAGRGQGARAGSPRVETRRTAAPSATDADGFEPVRGPRPARQARAQAQAQTAGAPTRGRGRPAGRGRGAKTPSATV
jgi:hypothetical protein